MSRQLPTIDRLLLTLSLACLLPFMALSLGLVAFHYQHDRNRVKASTISTARALMGSIDQRLNGVRFAVAGLAASPHLAAGNFEQFHAEAVALQRAARYSSIVVRHASGRQVVDTLTAYSHTPPDEARPESVKALAASAPDTVTVSRSPRGEGFLIGIGLPVQVGNASYVINATIDAGLLQPTLLRQRLPAGWIAAVIDGEGAIVVRTHDQEKFAGARVRASLLARMREVPEDAIESVTLDEVPVLTAFSRSTASGWATVIGIPREEVAAPIVQSLWLWLGGAGLVLLLTVVLSRSVARRISGSIDSLGIAARELTHLDHSPAARPAFLEAEQLRTAFALAAAALDDANASLRRSEAHLAATLEDAMDAIVTVDEESRVLLFNRAAAQMFGWSAAEMIGEPLDRLMPEAARPGHLSRMRQLTANTSRMMGSDRVVQALRRDGRIFPVEASISVMQEDGARFYTAILRDVTERQEHKEALLRSNLELQQFAFVASHDLRSPLRSIIGYLDLLASRGAEQLGAASTAILGRARRAAMNMDALTQDLLAYAKLDGATMPAELVDCGAAVADAVALLQEDVQDSGAQLHVGALPTIPGQRAPLIRLFQNLINNALKYRQGIPVIEIGARREPAGWLFWVRDNGIGIEPQYRDQIFEIFKRLHTRQDYPGTGIGLAVCKRVVQLHGGRIWAESEPGAGSTFFFTLADVEGTGQ